MPTQCHKVLARSDTGQEVNVVTVQSFRDLRQLQLDDGPIGLLLPSVEKGERPSTEDVKRQGPEARRLLQLWNRLVVEDGVLKRQYESQQDGSEWQQLVVPESCLLYTSPSPRD